MNKWAESEVEAIKTYLKDLGLATNRNINQIGYLDGDSPNIWATSCLHRILENDKMSLNSNKSIITQEIFDRLIEAVGKSKFFELNDEEISTDDLLQNMASAGVLTEESLDLFNSEPYELAEFVFNHTTDSLSDKGDEPTQESINEAIEEALSAFSSSKSRP